ncbi:HK97 family phage prohead protease [Mycobacteroides abscessus]|uniref:HK97 family phage prohead protease n=1 Tax=Mycobacteroides abscessus TaxID=36809 RepID=UPI0005DCBA8E|nr:HK97 family phage prohead protease [Mycobacteroides abscessus]CPR79289.1 HK97 family phage prohead protease [Mycobacteroides abscessus]CPR88441.1 HK97 family phage prohead protease [Mycobacteroides abscessus]CPS43366.1 HK97 family phage prohead protease [Mycobacteroides abscessus]CPV03168.1 HK97 family phage prohead protease [Mycobacteroides abscessus]
MQTKQATIQIKAGPDDGLAEGQFTAYASVFGNIDSYGDVVVKGAFANSLAEWAESGNPVPLLFGHNMSDPDYNIGHVESATEDDHGLLVTAQIDISSPKGLQVYKMLKGRRINQMSFAYDILDGSMAERPKAGETVGEDGSVPTESFYELRELKLYEVSVVTIGANQDTEILAVKAREIAAGTKAGRVLSAKNESELRDAHEAITRVLSALDSTSDEEKASESGPSAPAPDEVPVEANRKSSVNPSAHKLIELALANEI